MLKGKQVKENMKSGGGNVTGCLSKNEYVTKIFWGQGLAQSCTLVFNTVLITLQ